MRLLMTKFWKKIILTISCFFMLYLITFKINLSKEKSKIFNFENYNNFVESLKEFDKFYSNLHSILTNNQPNSNESNIFSDFNRVLFINKAILLDPYVFTSILQDVYSENEIKNFYQKQNLNSAILISYGIDIKNLPYFFKDLSHLELPCNVIPTVSEYSDLTIPASVYIKCEKFFYQVAVMYPRGNFYWIPKDDLKLEHVSKNFGDFNRALNRFKTVVIEYKSRHLTVPLDTDHFLYQYKHSKFIECNQQLAESTYRIQKQNAAKNTFFVSRFSYVKDIMESNKKVYWLMAGTLLGWYRECGVIPHTHDADISLYSDQFDANLQEIFLKDKLLPLSIKFGLDNDSLELRIGREGIFHMDIFFTYKLNQTHQWFPYHSGREVKRTTIKMFSGICSAQLLDEKFFIPCNPEKVLNDIYGEKGWQKPDKKFTVSPNLKKWKRWNLDNWLNAIKFFRKGTFLKDQTFNFIKYRLAKDEQMPDKNIFNG